MLRYDTQMRRYRMKMTSLRAIASALTVLLLLSIGARAEDTAGSVSGATTTAATSGTAATANVTTKHPMVLGAFLPGPLPMDQRIAAYATKTGRVPGIVMMHAAWGGSSSQLFYEAGIKANMQAIVNAGATPMLTWEPWAGTVNDTTYALRNIIPPALCPRTTTTACKGKFKAFLHKWATDFTEWLRDPESQGTHVLIRLAHEMNGSWEPWSRWHNGNTSAEYRAFWKYVVSTFRTILAGPDPINQPWLDVRSRVQWVFAPNEPSKHTTPMKALYPGDAWVDYLGFSAYNWGRAISWGTWRSMTTLFGPSITMLAGASKTRPIIASETASVEQGGSKAAWIRNGFAALRTKWPRLVGVVWYDFRDHRGPNWRVDTSTTSRAAYRKVVASSFYQGKLPD